MSFASHLTKGCVLPLQILIYHPAFIKYVFDSWLQGHGRYPSTGILSVIFSLHVCDEVRHPLPWAGRAALGHWAPHSMFPGEIGELLFILPPGPLLSASLQEAEILCLQSISPLSLIVCFKSNGAL